MLKRVGSQLAAFVGKGSVALGRTWLISIGVDHRKGRGARQQKKGEQSSKVERLEKSRSERLLGKSKWGKKNQFL